MTPPVSVESVESVESAKAKLLEMLCPALQHKLTSLTEKVEQIHLSTAGLSATGSSTDKYQNAQQLQVEFVRLLSLVNEVSALQKSLTAANATLLLEDFSLMAKRTFEHDQ
ncbi:MAG: hypothetical protein HC800_07625 [Phormidesmis sp. RL_2_1]|nr:hypothetical protein [Phormidesmis sp. RL_2_1]